MRLLLILVEDQNKKKLPPEVKNELESLFNMVHSNPRQAISELLRWIEKYPNIPVLYNYLSTAYSRVREFEKAERVVLENYQKNPDYLFAKLNYAEICLQKGRIEEIPKIFNNKFDLKLLYPNRKKFHISEFVGFTSIISMYFCEIGNFKSAEVGYKALKELAPDHELTKRLERKLYPSIIIQTLEKLVKKK